MKLTERVLEIVWLSIVGVLLGFFFFCLFYNYLAKYVSEMTVLIP